MLLKIRHKTEYHYDEPVRYGLQQLRLFPKSSHGQTVQSWSTTIIGGKEEVSFHDQHNNHVLLISIDQDVRNISVINEGEVITSDEAGVIGMHTGFTPLWYFNRQTALTHPGPKIKNLVSKIGANYTTDLEQLHALSALILKKVSYRTGKTDAQTNAEEALIHGQGVCQDHAHIFISAVRQLGYPARYVSGYLMMDGQTHQDASHAWAEAFIAGLGWVGFDISNGISPDERYVRVATGLDYQDAAPFSGLRFGDSDEKMIVSLMVEQ